LHSIKPKDTTKPASDLAEELTKMLESAAESLERMNRLRAGDADTHWVQSARHHRLELIEASLELIETIFRNGISTGPVPDWAPCVAPGVPAVVGPAVARPVVIRMAAPQAPQAPHQHVPIVESLWKDAPIPMDLDVPVAPSIALPTSTPAAFPISASATIPGKPIAATIPGKPIAATIPGKPIAATIPGKPIAATIPGKPNAATIPGMVLPLSNPIQLHAHNQHSPIHPHAQPSKPATSVIVHAHVPRPPPFANGAQPSSFHTTAQPLIHARIPMPVRHAHVQTAVERVPPRPVEKSNDVYVHHSTKPLPATQSMQPMQTMQPTQPTPTTQTTQTKPMQVIVLSSDDDDW